MKKSKTQKGITLIALIITIVVLLILAVVTINAIQGDGIIEYAKNAKDSYGQSQIEEERMLLELEYEIANAKGEFTGTYDEYVLDKKHGLKIGDYVEYQEPEDLGYDAEHNKNGKWRVLGVDDDENLLLVSDGYVEEIYLNKEDGYNQGISKLNTVCAKYADGIIGISGRSIKVEDINKITGYNPNNIGVYDPKQTGTGEKYSNSDGMKYGDIITYKLTSNGVAYSINNGEFKVKDSTWNKFYPLGNSVGLEKDNNNSVCPLEYSNYVYYPDSLLKVNTGEVKGISKTSAAYDMLFNDSTYGSAYYLANQYINPDSDGCFWGLRCVELGKISALSLHHANGDILPEYARTRAVRAVITISPEAELTFVSKNENGVSTFNISK